jgi:hypothetical protein
LGGSRQDPVALPHPAPIRSPVNPEDEIQGDADRSPLAYAFDLAKTIIPDTGLCPFDLSIPTPCWIFLDIFPIMEQMTEGMSSYEAERPRRGPAAKRH